MQQGKVFRILNSDLYWADLRCIADIKFQNQFVSLEECMEIDNYGILSISMEDLIKTNLFLFRMKDLGRFS